MTESILGSRRASPTAATLFALIFATGAWHAGLSQLSDNSFFCHLRTGQWILEHGVPHRDIYSFITAGTPWVSESWLAELLYASIEKLFGGLGLRLFTALTAAGIASLAYYSAIRLSYDRIRAAVLTAGALGASFTFWSARPLLLGLLAFATLISIVEVPRSRLALHPLLAIPAVIWLWANIHGSFVLGFVYLALHLFGRWLDSFGPWRLRERRLVAATALAFAVCLLNPYGSGLLLAPIHLVRHHNVLRNVVEWQSPDFRHFDLRAVMFALWLSTFTVCAIVGAPRLRWRAVVVSVPFLLLGFWAQRNIAIAPLVTLPIAARLVRRTAPRPDWDVKFNWAVASALVMLAIVWTLQAARVPDFDFLVYPVDAMKTVAAKGFLGRRLLSTDPWNDYVILRWWPRQYIFMDDRYDLYPAAVAEALVGLRRDQADWRGILARYGIEVVVWPPEGKIVEGLKHEPGWTQVYCNSTAVVFAKDYPIKNRLSAHASTAAPATASSVARGGVY